MVRIKKADRITEKSAIARLSSDLHVKCAGVFDCDQTAKDLVSWFNCTVLCESDLKHLVMLVQQKRFLAWNCITCGGRCYHADPWDWMPFQGVLQQDYTSYPGGHQLQCNSCRCYRWSEGEQFKRGNFTDDTFSG